MRKSTDEHGHPHLHLNIERLVEGDALGDASQGNIYHLNPEHAKRYQHTLSAVTDKPLSIGKMLDPSKFYFTKRLDSANHVPDVLLEASVFVFLPDVVTSEYPHRRMADINTWRVFQKLAAYLTESFRLR